ncbi:MAG: formate-dependent phosphoribosylglycinamide formyltransferase [Spirochaetes bacterium]|nr:formate-dependent phosphoribosylglycinamide formyltransferase [Spirochaetota bacterium]
MSLIIGTPAKPGATRVMLLGSGELGREVVIELMRLGCEVIAVDRYDGAPAQQVAHRAHTIAMLDGDALRAVIQKENPHFIVPEIEAIATEVLSEFEAAGIRVVPTARAAQLTMNREGIRRLAAEELKLKTSPYFFVESEAELKTAAQKLGFPFVLKPIMSSSGKGQSVVKSEAEIAAAFAYALEGGRGKSGRMIAEGFIDFDYEITLLTVRHTAGTMFCDPIGHRQVHGDYHESWQPHAMSETALKESKRIAEAVTTALGGYGLFGVELFVKGDTVWFSEVSPRPHDTGMVTMISQNYSEFALHARAFLGLPMPQIDTAQASASYVILGEGKSADLRYTGIEAALSDPQVNIRLFSKPEIDGERRLGVILATGKDVAEARTRAATAMKSIQIKYE